MPLLYLQAWILRRLEEGNNKHKLTQLHLVPEHSVYLQCTSSTTLVPPLLQSSYWLHILFN